LAVASDDFRPKLLEERLPEDWEPRIRSHFGLTMAACNGAVWPVERGADTKAYIEIEGGADRDPEMSFSCGE
jgi:hypothetical protein